jgi:hypothetical protein
VFQVGVDENVGLGFVVRLGVAEELPVRLGNGVKFPGTVGFQGGTTAPGFQPVGQVGLVDAGKEKFFLVVAVEEGDPVFLAELDEEVDDAFGVGTSIDVISDEDEVVVGLRGDEVDHVLQRIEAAVDVADGESSHGSAEA